MFPTKRKTTKASATLKENNYVAIGSTRRNFVWAHQVVDPWVITTHKQGLSNSVLSSAEPTREIVTYISFHLHPCLHLCVCNRCVFCHSARILDYDDQLTPFIMNEWMDVICDETCGVEWSYYFRLFPLIINNSRIPRASLYSHHGYNPP